MIRKKTGSAKKKSVQKNKSAIRKAGDAKKSIGRKFGFADEKGLRKRKPSQKRSAFSVFLVTLGIIIVASALSYVLLHPNINKFRISSPSLGIDTKTAKNHKPAFEIYPAEAASAKVAGSRSRSDIPAHRQPSLVEGLPKVAIIIDDIGYDQNLAEKFLNLDAVMTFSILPFSPHASEIAQAVVKKGYQVMLHLPMEPNESDIDAGKGKLLSSMTPDERIAQLELDLEAVPFVKGVNNHMGSKLTTLSDEMNQVFSELKKRDLFFIDSRTTAATQTKSSARLFKVPYAERDVFLDHVNTVEAIQNQIEQLIHVAEITGNAVGIGHPHKETYAVLAQQLPILKSRVRLVLASEIVEEF